MKTLQEMQQPNFRMTPDTFVTADSHFWHHKLVDVGVRPSLDTVNALLFQQWYATVSYHDVVLHLGDLAFSHRDRPITAEKRQQLYDLPGDKYLIRGNHDKSTVTAYRKYGFSSWYGKMMAVVLFWTCPILNKRIAFSHAPLVDPAVIDRWDINVHGHIHTNGYPHIASATAERKQFVCVCVEYTNYAPVRWRDLAAQIADPCYRDTYRRVGLNSHDDSQRYLNLLQQMTYIEV